MPGGKKLCRVAYGSDSSLIQVHQDFKFILIAKNE